MKVKYLLNIEQSLADSKIGDTGELVGFCRGADERPYAVVVNDKNSLFDMVPLHSIQKTYS